MQEVDARFETLSRWLAGNLAQLFGTEGWGDVPPGRSTAASSDASFRQYFRWEGGGRSFIVMDAPPPQENCQPFVDICAWLASSGVHVPVIHAQDIAQGFLLLSDMGRHTYLDVIDEHNADALFADAIEALLAYQRLPLTAPLPSYDTALLRRELELFPEWYVRRHLGLRFDADQQAAWERISQLLIESALAQPQVLVHRDFMPRNLMHSEPNPGVLDFQDAVHGPVTYDISLPVQGRFSQLARRTRARLAARLLGNRAGAGDTGAGRAGRLPARQRPDGCTTPPQGNRYFRAHLPPRRQAALPCGRAALLRLHPCSAGTPA
ncbi:phosphotransferase [Pseudomonas sp. KNUC1026]|nr:phosphotransferase [Pseudomonas sp. KNUC1026]